MLSAGFLSYTLCFDRARRAITDIVLIAVGSGSGVVAISEWLTEDFLRWFLFAPIVIALLWQDVRRLVKSWAIAPLVLAFAIGVTGSVASITRNVIITATDLFRSDVISWTQIVAQIDNLRQANRALAIDESFVSAVEGDKKQQLAGVFHTRMPSQEIKGVACLLLLKQSNSGYETAPEIDGFDLIESRFVAAVRVFGLLYRTTKGYNYAIYHSTRQACR